MAARKIQIVLEIGPPVPAGLTGPEEAFASDASGNGLTVVRVLAECEIENGKAEYVRGLSECRRNAVVALEKMGLTPPSVGEGDVKDKKGVVIGEMRFRT